MIKNRRVQRRDQREQAEDAQKHNALKIATT
jgi:hypothetical protein